MSDEIRVTNAVTGGQKGQKKARHSLIPPEALQKVAEHYAIGAAKYEEHNWRRGYDWSLSYDAAIRHFGAFWAGEDLDEETGSPHLAAAVFHALTLLTFMVEHPELDDRPSAAKYDEFFGRRGRGSLQLTVRGAIRRLPRWWGRASRR